MAATSALAGSLGASPAAAGTSARPPRGRFAVRGLCEVGRGSYAALVDDGDEPLLVRYTSAGDGLFAPAEVLHRWEPEARVMRIASDGPAEVACYGSRARAVASAHLDAIASSECPAELAAVPQDPPGWRKLFGQASEPDRVATVWKAEAGSSELVAEPLAVFEPYRYSEVVAITPDSAVTVLHGGYPDTPYGDSLSTLDARGAVIANRRLDWESGLRAELDEGDLALAAHDPGYGEGSAGAVRIAQHAHKSSAMAIVHADGSFTVAR